MRARVVGLSVFLAVFLASGVATPSWAADEPVPDETLVAEFDGSNETLEDLTASIWAPPEEADDREIEAPEAPDVLWAPELGGRYGTEVVEPQQVPLAPAESPGSGNTSAPLREADPVPTGDAVPEPSGTPNPDDDGELTSTPDPSSPSLETAAPGDDGSEDTDSPDSAGKQVSALSAPSGVQVGAPGLGSLPSFGFKQIPISDDTVIRVNLANGNLLITANDAKISGPGVGLRIDRFYNGLSTAAGTFGGGWSSSVVSNDVGLLASGNDRVFYGPSGFQSRFTWVSAGNWTTPPGINATLTQPATTSDRYFLLTYNRTGEKLWFSQGGFLTGDFDRNDVGVSYTYSSGKLVSATQSSGRSATFNWSGSSLQTITDSANRTTTFTKNSLSQLSKVQSPDGAVNEFTYDSTGRIKTITVPSSNPGSTVVTFTYDTAHRVKTVIQKSTSPTWGSKADLTTTFTYGSGVTSVSDPKQNTTQYAVDAQGLITSATDPVGHVRSSQYNANGDVTATTDALGSGSTPGNQTTVSYDQLFNTTGVQLPTGAAASAIYAQGMNCPTASTGTQFQVQCSIDASGSSQRYVYDAAGNQTAQIDTTGGANSAIASRTYSTGAAGQCSTKKGQVCSATDGNGNVTTYAYDSAGNLSSVMPPAPLGATTYGYDSLGRVTSVTDGNNKTTSYQYDNADRLVKTTFANADELWASYYPNGTKAYDWDKAKYQVTYEYDAQGLITARKLLVGPGNPSSQTITMEYDKAGNMVTYTDPSGTVAYTYNNLDLVTQLTEPGGSCPTDPDASPTSNSKCVKFTYDANDREIKRIFPNDAYVNTYYDNAGRVTEIYAVKGLSSGGGTGSMAMSLSGGAPSIAARSPHPASDDTVRYKYSYSAVPGSTQPTDDRSRIQQLQVIKHTSASGAGTTTTYSYDSRGRLTQAAEMAGTTLNAQWQYAYDGANNRTQQIRTGSTGFGTTPGTLNYTFNAANELTGVTNSVGAFSYDSTGAQTSDGRTNAPSTFNDRGGLTSVGSNSYSSYGQGNAEPLTITNQSVSFLSSPLGVASLKNGSTGVTTAYTRLPDGSLVGQRNGAANSYYVLDIRGSSLGRFSGTGTWSASQSYSPYGEPRSSSATGQGLGYLGSFYDPQTKQNRLGARYYDSTVGRFSQFDPSGQESNPYAYANGDPINFSDPSGLDAVSVIVKIIDAVASGDDLLEVLSTGDLLSYATGALVEAACMVAVAAPTGGIGLAVSFGFCFLVGEVFSEAAEAIYEENS